MIEKDYKVDKNQRKEDKNKSGRKPKKILRQNKDGTRIIYMERYL